MDFIIDFREENIINENAPKNLVNIKQIYVVEILELLIKKSL